MRRDSTREHWETYWRDHRDIDRTYSTGDRLVREVLRDGPVAGCRVLEVGAGSGRDALGLARAGATVVVLDYAPASLEIVQVLGREQRVDLLLVRADALRMPFRDGSFDVVYHQGLLEHFRDPRPLVDENVRVTRHGGRVVVDVPQTFHAYTVMKQALIAVNAWFAGWETQYTPGGLERVLRDAGLRVRRTYGEWLVPGLGYRIFRELLKRGGVMLPLEPRGPAAWERFWSTLRARLGRHRAALYTCHVIGTVAEKP